MFYFLVSRWELDGDGELGGLLGSLSWEIFKGGPADPSAWHYWLAAMKNALEKNENTPSPCFQSRQVTRTDVPVQISSKEAYQTMVCFLDNERKITGEFEGLLSLLSKEKIGEKRVPEPAVWHDWLEAIKKAQTRNEDAAPEKYLRGEQ